MFFQFDSRAEKLSAFAKSGKEILDAFKALRADVYKDANLEDDHVREVVNRINLLAETLETKHLVGTRFASGPTVPAHRSGPSRVLLALLALFGGAIVSAGVLALTELLRSGKATRTFGASGRAGNTV